MIQRWVRDASGDTRTALIDAARAQFAARGVAASRVADITAAAGVSVGTFYTHFGSKRQILDVLLDELTSGLFPSNIQPDSPRAEQVYRLNRTYLEAFASDAALWYAVERAALTDAELAGALSRHRQELVRRVEILVGDQSHPGERWFTAFSLVAMVEECAYYWFVYETPPDIDQAARQLGDLWCRMTGAA